MTGADLAFNGLLEAGVEVVVALPDSLLAPLCYKIKFSERIRYIQATHESDCVGIACGLSLSGVRSLVLMENSGLRNACETIARLQFSHHIFTCYLVSDRGAFGERNWWGQAHHETMLPMLSMLRIPWEYLNAISELPGALGRAFDTLAAGQSGAALIAGPGFVHKLER